METKRKFTFLTLFMSMALFANAQNITVKTQALKETTYLQADTATRALLIFNHKTKKYIENVRVKWESWYAGPLAAYFCLKVYIDDNLFYTFALSA